MHGMSGGDAMLTIALCDDEEHQRQKIKDLVSEYFDGHVNLKTYKDGQKLLDHIEFEGKDLFDLYILDVIMPQLSGIELGRKLRRIGVCAPIIYLTSSRDYAVESYNVRAFHYMVKPIEKEKLFPVLAQAENVIAQSKTNSVTINTPGGAVVIRTSEILYAELYSRSVRYYLTNGASIDSQKLRISFQKAVGGLLELKNFTMLGSSFLVNLHHIKKVNKKELILVNNQILSIPKGTKNDLLRAWMDYWLNEENNEDNK